ncbi:mannose-1-phosphate guanylyltransferase 1-like isoform X1 [Hibiscus syriacus]|uniref:Mannose-1-phosphate guanylyltransferase 1-like isoform X1 n=1 Tax=Hibiscus syriacus TaxID=106335 RepID=A0A6A3B9A7_HIBSY|nr:RING-H2 finger protein ATL66-like [Hibiscus syriacus]KAE8712025.1 mannose-1-phosphate guanylyltransferase 1-like isoform X1 [Hibiscus syriacus]
MASSQHSHPFHWHYAELEDHHLQIRGRTLFIIVLLVLITLIVALVFVYARWACRRFNLNAPSPTSHALPDPQPRGLDPAAINSLPVTMFTLEMAVQTECCICLGVFEDGEKVKVLPPCNHSYHPECVDQWLSSESSCPLCRASLRVESDQLQVVVTQ